MNVPSHFEPFDKAQDKLREKSVLDPSHSLGMTIGRLAVLRHGLPRQGGHLFIPRSIQMSLCSSFPEKVRFAVFIRGKGLQSGLVVDIAEKEMERRLIGV